MGSERERKEGLRVFDFPGKLGKVDDRTGLGAVSEGKVRGIGNGAEGKEKFVPLARGRRKARGLLKQQ